jgi:hypothetical protein
MYFIGVYKICLAQKLSIQKHSKNNTFIAVIGNAAMEIDKSTENKD